jgi:Glucoamylase and related glycosyl hydrolases
MTKFYSFLSNGITSALELNGSIEWLTFPRFDSPAVFCKILDKEKGGSFEVKPLDEVLLIQRNYMGNSLVLKTVFITRVGKLELIDFLPIGLTALIRIYNSDIPFRVIINPVFNYGLINSSIEEVENGIIYRNPLSKEALELLIKGRYSRENHYGLIFQPGRGYLYLLYSRDIKYGLFSAKGIVYSKPEEALNRAISYWESRVNKARKVREFKDIYERSLLVLLGLIYSPSGGLIASPTTSLPEVIGSQRNWDYRYVWVRDASYSAEALIKAGLVVYARNILSFLLSVIDPSSKSFDHPLYAVDGSPPPAEESLNWLSGFMNSYPVRIGNAAYLQIQMDIEGAFMNALSEYYFMTEDKEYLDDNWFAIESIADWVKSSWREKSTDIWEERDTLEHFVHTKVMSWVALDRASKIAYSLGYKREG